MCTQQEELLKAFQERKDMQGKLVDEIKQLRSKAQDLQQAHSTRGMPVPVIAELREVIKFLNRIQLSVHMVGAVGNSLMETSSKYAPPKQTQLSLMKEQLVDSSVIRSKIVSSFAWFADRFLGKDLDAQFLENFAKEMLYMYPHVRHIASNARNEAEIELLSALVSRDLIDVLKANLDDMPSSAHARGVEVHDVFAVPTGLHFTTVPGKKCDGFFSFDPTVQPRMEYVMGRKGEETDDEEPLKEEYVQVHIRFSALERDTVSSEGKVVQRAPAVLRKSTWVYEGKLLNLDAIHRQTEWKLIAITE